MEKEFEMKPLLLACCLIAVLGIVGFGTTHFSSSSKDPTETLSMSSISVDAVDMLGEKVFLEFSGHAFSNPTSLLPSSSKANQPSDEFTVFFRRFFLANSQGDLEELLSVWLPSERQQVKSTMTPETLKLNHERFKLMTFADLELVVKQPNYFIALVRAELDGYESSFVMPFPFVRSEGSLYLTNDAQNDSFYKSFSMVEGEIILSHLEIQ